MTWQKQTFECTHCKRKQEVEVFDSCQVPIGTTIKPSTPTGLYGRCRFCKKTGLKCLTAPAPEKIGAVGWRK